MYACIYVAYQGQQAFQVVLVVKNPPANAGDIRDPGLRRSSRGRHSKQPTPVFLPGESHGEL